MKLLPRTRTSVRALAIASICLAAPAFLFAASDGVRDAAADLRTHRSASPNVPVAAALGSTSTTTTLLPPPPTTTLEVGIDVTGGGRFHAGFTTGSHDLFTFALTTPAVLVAVTSDGKDFCNGDTTMELSLDGLVLATDDDSGPGQCSKIVIRLEEPAIYQIIVAGYAGEAVPNYYFDVQFVTTDCGNAVVELLEECDDGNFADGDCCSSSCTNSPDGTPCDDGLLCDGDDTCASGACTQHSLNPCPGTDGDGDCSETCSDTVVGCGSPDPDWSSCNDGQFCNGADRCFEGACNAQAGDPCRGPDGDGNCRESCNESSDSCNASEPNGTVCDDTLFCNGSDHCDAGLCSVHSGGPCLGPDGDANCAESCSESKENCTASDPNGSSCNDGLFCTGADSCSGGSCSVHAGNGCPGPDNDSNCAESCDEATQLCNAADPAGAACDDGIFCDGADTCLGGSCGVHAGDPCAGPAGDSSCAESCNEASDNCTASDPDGSACDDGLFCNGADTCSAGACAVHAGSPCAGQDGDSNCAETCNEASDNCTASDPNGSACNDGLFCNGADSCSAGACTGHAGSPCAGPDGDSNCSESCDETLDLCTATDPNGSACNDGVFCNGADTCSAGACTVHPGNPCTGPDGDSNCAESCSEASDTCTASDPDGSACNDSLFCNGTDSCSSGSCGAHSGDPCAGADGDGNCAESCSEASDTCTASDPNGSACNDSLFCNGGDTCASGSCSAHAGNPCPGADGDQNCSETCNEAGDACNAADPDGAVCNDGVFCNGADTCAAGSCGVHPGNPCPGADGDGNCSETCNETADNCAGADPAGSACNDGLACNGVDTCSGGNCTQHSGNPCPGADGDADCAESCSDSAPGCSAPDPTGSPCDDGVFCDGSDSCSGGTCSVHAGNPCPGADGDGNCAESCSEASDNCTASDSNGAACNDGLFCNGADSCASGACSVHAGNPCDGADGDADCSEICNEAGDACDAADPDGSACSDGLFCNGGDTCASGSCSIHTGNPCAGPDGDSNCAETCSEASDTCTASDPNGSVCSDSLFCNGSDTCSNGTCGLHSGDPCPGVDGDGNCAESCGEASDTCTGSDPNGSACNDGLFCNGADTCSAGACTVHAGSPCAGPDGDGNCAESCNETGDSCTGSDPNGSACSDGLFCNGADTCSAGACTVHAGSSCAGADGDGNCAESCNETNDSCTTADPNGSSCDDGLFCNGDDSCSGGGCSQHAGSPCPGADGDGNCAESCDEQADACSASDPNGTACDDSVFCNSADTCSAGSCSAHPGSPCPGPDGDGDCAESCNETTDTCNASDPDGAACNDGVFCDGPDTCAAGSCSQHSGTPCPGADGDGNCAESCDDVADACTAFDPDGAACSDANSCTTDDACDGTGDCVGGPAVDCEDGDPCTTDLCSSGEPLCTHSKIENCPPSTTTTLVAFVCGDVSGDSSVTAGDALAVLQSSVGGTRCAGMVCVCDVNGNGPLTASDALLALRFAVGLPVTLACSC